MVAKPRWKPAGGLARRTALSCLLVAAASATAAGTTATGGYSPYPEQDFPNQVFFGDTHVHTAYSSDAGLFGNTLGPEEAFRFARGETVVSSTGLRARLQRPLDFLVVTDHAEFFGFPVALAERDPELLATQWGRSMAELAAPGTNEARMAVHRVFQKQVQTLANPLPDSRFSRNMWLRATAAADSYNAPGAFTAFIGFEWSLTPGGKNLHRNVIFRDGGDRADRITPFSSYDAQDPEKLWDWMASYERDTGGKVLAIPHNGNLSNGMMFDDARLTGSGPLDRDYAERRMRWEPLYEVTQIKGDSETHPLFSPEDEFASFETWDRGSLGAGPKTPDMLPREYARPALTRGLAYSLELGANPFKFGLIGSTDSHTSLTTSAEDNFFGKATLVEPGQYPRRFEEAVAGRTGPEEVRSYHYQASAAGLAGLWARENSREALWDAMARKEVFATTGTRLRIRVFGGWNFQPGDLDRPDFARHGYADGVPMGGDLASPATGSAPVLMVRAMRDADGANLDRIQVIKGWVDDAGQMREQIYDVACAGARKITERHRCDQPVGDTVDIERATYSNSIGAPFLQTWWRDPDFNADRPAFYYVRALEIPTPRWTTIDAAKFGLERPRGVPAAIQERAYTSPIWYTPDQREYN
jgi:hypothetical protein